MKQEINFNTASNYVPSKLDICASYGRLILYVKDNCNEYQVCLNTYCTLILTLLRQIYLMIIKLTLVKCVYLFTSLYHGHSTSVLTSVGHMQENTHIFSTTHPSRPTKEIA
jgi:hypothetical protein